MQNSSPPPLHPMPTSNSTADDSGFNINLNSFTLVMLMGVLMYSLMLSLVHRKLSILHARSKDLNIIKLFVMSCWFAVLIRLLSFVGLGALSIANINVNYKFTGEFHSASARLARSNPPVTPPPSAQLMTRLLPLLPMTPPMMTPTMPQPLTKTRIFTTR